MTRVSRLAAVGLVGALAALGSPAPAAAHARACALIPRAPLSGEWFGFAMAADGDLLAVGAPGDPRQTQGSGTVYVFRHSGGSWSQQGEPLRSGTPGDRFGVSVALHGDRLAVGAPGAGAVFLFRREGSGWIAESPSRLAPPDRAPGDRFGLAVALADDTVVVGAPSDSGRGSLAGAVYVFRRSGAGWALPQKLVAGDAQPTDQLGSAVAIDGDTLVVGAPSADDLTHHRNFGAVYVFERTNETWGFRRKLTAGLFVENDIQFGAAVALSGQRLVVGAPGEDRGGANRGAAFVFARSDWTPAPFQPPEDRDNGDLFGSAVAIDGGTIVIGAPFHRDGGVKRGAAFVGDDPEPVTGTGASADSQFGGSVALMSGDVVLVGGSRDDPSDAVDAGAVAYCEIGPPCDLLPEITKTGPAGAVLPGQEISYTVVVSNLCSAPVTAQVRDVFDPKLDSVRWCRAEGDGACTPAQQPGRDIGESLTLPAGKKATYRVNARIAATARGVLVNQACVSNSAAERCAPPIRNPIGVDLRLTLEAVIPPASIVKGRTVTFRWKVENLRNTKATGIKLTILPPPSPDLGAFDLDGHGIHFLDLPFLLPPCYDGPNPLIVPAAKVEAQEPEINAADNKTVSKPGPAVLDGTADVAVTQQIFDSQGAPLAPAAGGEPGDRLTYRVTVDNLGPDTACGVVLSDPFPAGLVPVPLSPDPCLLGGTCLLGEMGKDETPRTLEATFEVGPIAVCPAAVPNTATVSTSGSIDSNSGNDASTAVITVDEADLEITKEGPATATAGDPLTYTLRVRNKGCRAIPKARVTDAFSAALLQVRWCEGTGCTPSLPGDLDRTLSLAPGDSREFHIQGIVSPLFEGTLTNTARVAAPDGLFDEATVATEITLPPGFQLFCTGVDGPFAEGDAITCVFVLLNGGPAAQADNAGDEFTVTLPAGLTLVSASAGSGATMTSANTATWNGAVPAGGRVDITVEATVDAGTAGTTICLQASAFLDSDGNGVNDTVFLSDRVDSPGLPAEPCCFRVLTAEEIPALSSLGTLVLSLLLAAAALVRLRRATPPPA
jgi:uncharacterized repeat protein (TIGR01451 family)